MDGSVTAEIDDGVAVLRLPAPPASTLGQALRLSLLQALDRVTGDPGLRGLVLTGQGTSFSAGSDLRDIGRPAVPGIPDLGTICARIEALQVPVVAALHGPALGAGAELALAAHYRLAAPGAQFGLPDIALGLVPGAGGSQRLPRLCDASTALDLLLRGRPVSAAEAQQAGIYDAVLQGDPEAAARVLARKLADGGSGPRPVLGRRDRQRDGVAWLDAVRQRRLAVAALPLTAAGRVIDCVEAALLLPPAAGLRFERLVRKDCLADPQFAALSHIYLAERQIPAALMQRAQGRRVPTAAGSRVIAALQAALDRCPDPGAADHPGAAAIRERRLAAVVAQGARLLAAGQVVRAADLDALAVHGLGWPRLSGGPLHCARSRGLATLVAAMPVWAEHDPIWAVPPLLAEAARRGGDYDAARAALRPATAAAPAAVKTG